MISAFVKYDHVIAGLDPAIQRAACSEQVALDARVKPGHDG